MNENVLLFGNSLVGIITRPARPNPQLPAVILLNAGLIHRVGPNRLYVEIARYLAEQGIVVLRFDFSGIGDSKVREDNLPLEQKGISETQAAMDCLAQTAGINRFLLMGHCAGAMFSFLTACADLRVTGAVLINPQGNGEEWAEYDRGQKLARYYSNYYSKAVFTDPQRWLRLLKGQVDYRSVARNIFQNILWNKISAPFQLRKLNQAHNQVLTVTPTAPESEVVTRFRQLIDRGAQLLLVYSANNSGLDYVRTLLGPEFDRFLTSGGLKLEIIAQADHLFNLLAGQQSLLQVLREWVLAVAQTGVETNAHPPELDIKGLPL